MDYMFFTEYGVFGTLGEAEASIQENGGLQRQCLTVMVPKDFRYNSIWAYPVEGKGVGAAKWLVTQILEDLDTCGLDGCRLVFKCDQEPSIVEVQHAIKRQGPQPRNRHRELKGRRQQFQRQGGTCHPRALWISQDVKISLGKPTWTTYTS